MQEQERLRVKKAIERVQSSLEKLKIQLVQATSNEKTPQAVVQKIAGTIEQQKRELSLLQEQASFLR